MALAQWLRVSILVVAVTLAVVAVATVALGWLARSLTARWRRGDGRSAASLRLSGNAHPNGWRP